MVSKIKRMLTSITIKRTLTKNNIVPGSPMHKLMLEHLYRSMVHLDAALTNYGYYGPYKPGIAYKLIQNYPHISSLPQPQMAYLKLSNEFDHYTTKVDEVRANLNYYIEDVMKRHPSIKQLPEFKINGFIRKNGPKVFSEIVKIPEEDLDKWLIGHSSLQKK